MSENMNTVVHEAYRKYIEMRSNRKGSVKKFDEYMDVHGKNIIEHIYTNPHKDIPFKYETGYSSENIKSIFYPYIFKYYPDFSIKVLFDNIYMSTLNNMIRDMTHSQLVELSELPIKSSTAKQMTEYGDDSIRRKILEKFTSVDILRSAFRNTSDPDFQKEIYQIGIKTKSNKFLSTVAYHAHDSKIKTKAILIKK